LPPYFREEETQVSAERVNEILHEIEALPPAAAKRTKALDGSLREVRNRAFRAYLTRALPAPAIRYGPRQSLRLA
jgi:hypothetical protein